MTLVRSTDHIDGPIGCALLEIIGFWGDRYKAVFNSLSLHEGEEGDKTVWESLRALYDSLLIWCASGRIDLPELVGWAKQRRFSIEVGVWYNKEQIEVWIRPEDRRFGSDPSNVVLVADLVRDQHYEEDDGA